MIIKLISLPLNIIRYTSFFGIRWIKYFHRGIDIGASVRGRSGDEVKATSNGVVRKISKNVDSYGNYIVIEHDGWCDLFAHLKSFNVRLNQKVVAGQVVAKMGSSGCDPSAVHLHYEIRLCDFAHFNDMGTILGFTNVPKYLVDPKPYLDALISPKVVPQNFKNKKMGSDEMIMGIDVSHNNGSIDWKKVAKAGVDFAIIRAGYGWSSNQIDKKFVYNMNNALKNGIDVGCYWFSYAYSPHTARLEAELFLKTIRPFKITYPLAFDWEYDSINYANNYFKKNKIKDEYGNIKTMTPKLACEIADTFLMTCANAGYYVINYTNPDLIQNYFTYPCMNKFEKWIAKWSKYKPSMVTGLWQNEVRGTAKDIERGFASVLGSLSGVKGCIDMDISYKDYPTIIQNAGLNHLAKPVSQKTNIPEILEKKLYLKGEKVKVLKNIIYGTNKTFAKFYSTYDVLYDQKEGSDRIVLGYKGKIVSAIDVDNVQRV